MTVDSNTDHAKHDLDNRANQLNPNNEAYRMSRKKDNHHRNRGNQSDPSTSRSGSRRTGTTKAASHPMIPDAAARIQSATAKKHGGTTPKGSFAARGQSAASRRNKGKS